MPSGAGVVSRRKAQWGMGGHSSEKLIAQAFAARPQDSAATRSASEERSKARSAIEHRHYDEDLHEHPRGTKRQAMGRLHDVLQDPAGLATARTAGPAPLAK
jgi:hypothetical protein